MPDKNSICASCICPDCSREGILANMEIKYSKFRVMIMECDKYEERKEKGE